MTIHDSFTQRICDFFKNSNVMTCSLRDAKTYGELDAEKSIALMRLFSERVQKNACVMA